MSTETLQNLEICVRSLEELLPSLTDEQWEAQSLCPDWTVREVITHLAGVEHMLTEWKPQSAEEPLPFEKLAASVAEFAARTEGASGAELVDRWRSIMDIRRTQWAAMTVEDLDRECMTPVGPATYGRFMAIRVFDHWVHEQDIRRPLGIPGHETGPAAEMSIDEIQGSLGYIAGKKIGLPDGISMTVSLTGPVTRTMHVAVDGRARVVPALDHPDVTLTSDSTTFALLACGRIDPSAEIEGGRISWSGDDEWGERAARNLAFTM